MRPVSEGEDVPLDSPTPSQGDENKRKMAPSSLDSEKKKPKKRLARKAKESTSTLSSDSIRRLRDESEEEEEDNFELVARHEAEVWELTNKRDTYKLLSEKLHTELEVARKEHTEWDEQVRQRLEQIGQLQVQVDAIQTEADEFNKNKDLITSQKETVQAQLASVEAQLRAAKEKTSVQAKRIEELQSKLYSAISGQESLATELEAAKSEVAVASTKDDAKVAQFKVDVEAIQAHSKSMVDHARWEALREALEGVLAQGFDILEKIENSKVEEARARKLAFPEEGFESLTESEGGEDPEGEDAAPHEDQAT
ncbi:uncharacterized protein [Nicotiana tomentosiformis]|uniref:uncharacterized protein n=1 Tax=Nicotiana tomentosiformis TaxID=4098 RepID=UPI00051C6C2A|nr:tropomyosin-like [Nicotiana tomentosiformis]